MVRAVDLGKLAVWQARLRRFAESGSSIAKFCRQEGVSAPSFYLWRKRLDKNRGSVGSAKEKKRRRKGVRNRFPRKDGRD
jgi:transposase-like protein